MPVLLSSPCPRRRRSRSRSEESSGGCGGGGGGWWLSGGVEEVSVSVLQWDKEGRVGRVPSTRTQGGFIKVIGEEVSVVLCRDESGNCPPPRKILRLCPDDPPSTTTTPSSSTQDPLEVCVCCGCFGLRSEFYKPRYCVATCFFNCAREELKEVAVRNAPLKLFRQPALPTNNPFKVGMLLEALDPENASLFCVVSVVRVIGCRVELHFEGYPSEFDFFVNADSIDIFPPGWTVENGHELQPPLGVVSDFSWPQYVVMVRKQPAPRGIFQVVREQHQNNNSSHGDGGLVRVGMKLEAVDIHDNNNSESISSSHGICVASVSKVMGDRFLVHFDSWDCIYDYWADLTCPFIHPCGFAKANHKFLNPPNSWKGGSFEWEEYMEAGETALPAHLFQPLPPVGFKKGMRIEAVDNRRRWLLRPAVVVGVDGHMLTIQYEQQKKGEEQQQQQQQQDNTIGDDSGGGLVRVTELSSDIHPVGYARHTNHPISCSEDSCWGSGGVTSAQVGVQPKRRRERVVVVNEGSRTLVVTPGELYGSNSIIKKERRPPQPPAVMTSPSPSPMPSPLSPPQMQLPPSLPVSLVAEKMSLLALRVVLARKKPLIAPKPEERYIFESLLRGILSGPSVITSLTVNGLSSIVSRVCSREVVGMLREGLVDGDALLLLKREDLPRLPLGAWVKLNYIKWLILNNQCRH